uniref:Uncharacterized protein n=1 Tax=Arundo donax TaxID=35708 RepID=A0A0A8ZRL9_ARUDO
MVMQVKRFHHCCSYDKAVLLLSNKIIRPTFDITVNPVNFCSSIVIF